MLWFLAIALAADVVVAPADGPWTNRLAESSSPFLQAHGDNPVDWRPWGEEAFAEAAERNVPVLLSIGFDTCVYCWEMEGEVFTDPVLAAQINESVVPVLVDRDQRPGVDAIYREALQELIGRSGWPTTLFLTPAGVPYDGGTVFWKKARGGRPAFGDVLDGAVSAWAEEPDQVEVRARTIRQRLLAQAQRGTGFIPPKPEAIEDALADLMVRETEVGGWGTSRSIFAPTMGLLTDRLARGVDDVAPMATRVVDRAWLSALRDHFGNGYFDTTDEFWQIPDYEKSLAGNALAAQVFLDMAQLTGEERYQVAARSALSVLSELTPREEPGFYVGYEPARGFYQWTDTRVREALPPRDARRILAAYHVDADPGVPWLASPLAENLHPARIALTEARRQRTPPRIRSGRPAGDNGLAISALARGVIALDDRKLLGPARTTANELLKQRTSEGRLPHDLATTGSKPTIDDYAFVVNGLLDLYAVDPDARWLIGANELARVMRDDLRDPLGGYHYSAADESERLAPQVQWTDGRVRPSGLGMALLAEQRLAAYGAKGFATEDVDKALARARRYLEGKEAGLAFPTLLRALANRARGSIQVVIAGTLADPKVRALYQAAHAKPRPGVAIAVVDPDNVPEGFKAFEGKTKVGTAWVCRDHVCEAPTTEPRSLGLQLADVLE